MTPQSTFMIVAPLADGQEASLRELLASMNGRDGGMADPDNPLVPFGRFDRLHFARFLVIDAPTAGDRVSFGSTVLLEDESGKEFRYQIVGSDEGDPTKGKISVLAPLARTLIGRTVGDTVTAQLPNGKKTFEIVKANFPLE